MENLKKIEEIEQIEQPEMAQQEPARLEPVFDLKPIRHGLRARAMMLKGENLRDFNELCNSLELEWSPRTPTEQFYVEQMCVSQWKLHRMQIVEYDAFFDKKPSDPGGLPLLERLTQCQVRLERSYARAQHDLQRLQKTRPRPARAQRYEPIEFIPDPPRDAEDPQPGPDAQVIDISTGTPVTEPEDAESPTTHRPQPTTQHPPPTPPSFGTCDREPGGANLDS